MASEAIAGPALAACPGPQHYMSICNQPLPLCRHLQLFPTAKCVHTPGPGHHCCQPWSPADGPGGTTNDPNNLCSYGELPEVLTKNRTVIDAVDPSSLSLRNLTLPRARCHHKPPHLEFCTPRPRLTACSRVPLPVSEISTYQTQSIKSRRGDCFFKSTDSC